MALVAFAATLFSGTVAAVPNGYSINSDSPSADADSLYLIDLASGSHSRIGTVMSFGQVRIDVEGLAISPDGTLYGVDDSAATLFPINTSNGSVITSQEVVIDGIPTGGGNDFGMTFGCDGNLYISSIRTQTLYRMALDGTATPVGGVGNLGANIGAIAAYGNPVKLYGLGNGLNGENQVDSRQLYLIDTTNGTARAVGSLGGSALDYHEAGMAFDEAGMLWAITDRRAVDGGPFPSQILRVDTSGGGGDLSSAVSSTSEVGFESLAISPPRGCFQGGAEDSARFLVSKRFMDFNNRDSVSFNLTCNTGLPLEQSLTVSQSGGAPQDLEINFVVRDFESGELDCTLSEEVPTGYEASYSCDGESSCSAGAGSPLDPYFVGPCSFSDVELGDDNVCFVRNYVAPVDVEVTKLWIDENPQFLGPTNAQMGWTCINARSSGDDMTLGEEQGTLAFRLSEETQSFPVYPNFDPAQPTICTVVEDFPAFASDIETDDSDCEGLLVTPGNGNSCTVTNTRFYEGIPTLSQYGKAIMALLMLTLGFVAFRRVV